MKGVELGIRAANSPLKKITDAVFLGKQTLIRVFVSWELIRDMINNLHELE